MKSSLQFGLLLLIIKMLCSCNNQNGSMQNKPTGTHDKPPADYAEGKDYFIYERVRMLDKAGFSESQEDYNVLLSKGWHHQVPIK